MPISFKKKAEFNLLLKDTIKIKDSENNSSSIRRIYDILEMLYSDEVKNNNDFNKKMDVVYKNEIGAKFNNGTAAFDIKYINAPDSDAKPIHRQTLHLLLALICNKTGNNGENLPPHLYARGLLSSVLDPNKYTQIDGSKYIPNTANNLNGINYSSFLKHMHIKNDINTYKDLVNSVFLEYPSEYDLAVNAKESFIKFLSNESSSSLANARYNNNMVDLYITCIHLANIGIKKENGDMETIDFKAPDNTQSELINSFKSMDFTKKFEDMRKQLDEARDSSPEAVIAKTMAQLFSLEGEIKEKADPKWCEVNVEWCKQKREKAFIEIESAIKFGEKTEDFTKDRSDMFYFSWLYKNDEMKIKIEKLIEEHEPKKDESKNK
jgi:hypothetical protein